MIEGCNGYNGYYGYSLVEMVDLIKNDYGASIIECAQSVYDDWLLRLEIDNKRGGICEYIAVSIVRLLKKDTSLFVGYIEDRLNFHTYVRVLNNYPEIMNESESLGFVDVTIDIPWQKYEIYLSPYNYSPIPDVKFCTDDLVVDGIIRTESYKEWEFITCYRLENELRWQEELRKTRD